MIELLFKKLLQCSLVGSIGFLLIIFLRKTLFKEYTKAFNYYIWLGIIVKMLMPFKIPIHISQKLNLKLYNIWGQLPKAILNNNNVINENIKNNFISEYSTYNNISVFKIISYLWLIGMVAFAAYHIFSYFNFISKIKHLTYEFSDDNISTIYSELLLKMKIKRNITLKFCRGIEAPLGTGFLKPCILLPKVIYSNKEIQWILKHELIHYKKHDILYKLIIMITMAIHWFNPLVYIMQQIINSDCELSCDEAVLKDCDIKERKIYATTLLHSLKANKRNTLQNSVSTGFNQNKNILKRRLENMINLRIRKKGIVMGTLVVIIAAISLISVKTFAEDNINKTATAPLINSYSSKELKNSLLLSNQSKIAYVGSLANISKEYNIYFPKSNLNNTEPTENISLTIDKDVQDATEMELDKVMNELRKKWQQINTNETTDMINATRGAAVVIDVKTGDVLASVHFGK